MGSSAKWFFRATVAGVCMKSCIFGTLVAAAGTVFLPLCVEAAGAEPSRVILENTPSGVEIIVNGLNRQPDFDGMLKVDPGPVLLELRQNRVVVYSSFFQLEPKTEKRITFNCDTGCALLHIVTEPPGAQLSMSGTILGLTPYMNRFVKPGSYSIMATCPGYIPVIRRIDVRADSAQLFSYVMEQTQMLRDSIFAVRKALLHRRQGVRSLLLGTAGVGFAVSGVIFETKAYRHLENAQKASKAYETSRTDIECQRHKAEYRHHRELAEKPILYRNILYGASGVCLAGFFLNFIF